MDNYHLTKKDGQWKLTKEGGKRASLTAETKADAVKKSAEHLAGKGASLKIHKVDGKIQEERTYPRSADPRKSPG